LSSIFITGVAGYVGSVLVRNLLDNDYNVIGCDSLEYNNKYSIDSIIDKPNFNFLNGDITNDKLFLEINKEEIDVFINLAAIVGDPACGLKPEKAVEVNYDATIKLAELMLNKDIDLFILASTCSIYGKNEIPLLNEETEGKPVSLYGWSKVLAEKGIKRLGEKGLPFSILRYATAHGYSFRPRFDLVVNNFALRALTNMDLTVFGGTQIRPFIHVKDMCKAIMYCISNIDKAKGEIFNAGNEKENYSILQVAKIIKEIIPSTNIKILEDIIDERSYSVSFNKIQNKLNFMTSYTIKDTVNDVSEAIQNHLIKDPKSKLYYNI
jgi:nucleoside-diphosphate-sugar epimerase